MKPSQTLLREFSEQCQQLRNQGWSIFGLHQDSIVLCVTSDAEKDLEYSVSEMLGMNAWKLFDSHSFEEITQHLFSQESALYDAIAVKKSGARFSVRMNILNTHLAGETVRLVAYKLNEGGC